MNGENNGAHDIKMFLDGVEIGTAQSIDISVEREKAPMRTLGAPFEGTMRYEGVQMVPASTVRTVTPYRPKRKPKSKRLKKKYVKNWLKANGLTPL